MRKASIIHWKKTAEGEFSVWYSIVLHPTWLITQFWLLVLKKSHSTSLCSPIWKLRNGEIEPESQKSTSPVWIFKLTLFLHLLLSDIFTTSTLSWAKQDEWNLHLDSSKILLFIQTVVIWNNIMCCITKTKPKTTPPNHHILLTSSTQPSNMWNVLANITHAPSPALSNEPDDHLPTSQPLWHSLCNNKHLLSIIAGKPDW